MSCPSRPAADWDLRRKRDPRRHAARDGPAARAGTARAARPAGTSAETDCGSYVRRAITYATEPDERTPAWLLVPKQRPRRRRHGARAVLCLHPTDAHDRPRRRRRPRRTPQSRLRRGTRRARLRDLSRRRTRMLANYQPDVHGLGYASGTMKAIWDNVRGARRAGVAAVRRRAAASAPSAIRSAGTTPSTRRSSTSASRVVVSSCGLDLYTDYYGGDPKVWQPEQGLVPGALHAAAARLRGPARRTSRSTSRS